MKLKYKLTLKLNFLLFSLCLAVVFIFFPVKSEATHPFGAGNTPALANVSVSPTSFNPGPNQYLTVSGTLEGGTLGAKCPFPANGKVPNSLYAGQISSVKYYVSNSGPSGNLDKNTDWFLFDPGYDVPCGADFTESYNHRQNVYNIISSNQIPVGSLGPGNYTVDIEITSQSQEGSHTWTWQGSAFGWSFSINTPPTGTINVNSNVATSWYITGPDNFCSSGNPCVGTSATYNGPAAGNGYEINFANPIRVNGIDYEITTSPNSPQNLSNGGTINFNVTYSTITGPSGTITATPTSCTQRCSLP